VVLNAKKAAIIQRIPVPGARLSHKVVIDSSGAVYVSDMRI
jgi:hypothetical protein